MMQTESKHKAKRKRTGSKQKANREQTRSKQKANREQTESKHEANREQTESKQEAKQEAKRKQKGSKQKANMIQTGSSEHRNCLPREAGCCIDFEKEIGEIFYCSCSHHHPHKHDVQKYPRQQEDDVLGPDYQRVHAHLGEQRDARDQVLREVHEAHVGA
jgi:hypothetical protein